MIQISILTNILVLIVALRATLLELGYFDVYHIASLMVENPSDSEMWCEAIDAKFYGKGNPYDKDQWDKLLGHCMVSQRDLGNLEGDYATRLPKSLLT